MIKQICDNYQDDKDCGSLTLTHLYLLVGCSTPLWLANISQMDNKLLLSVGVVTIGIGDACASLGGYYLGKHKWPRSNKSIEGTGFCFSSQVLAYLFLHHYYEQTSQIVLINVTVISLISSLYESVTNQIDNLTLPLLTFLLVQFIGLTH